MHRPLFLCNDVDLSPFLLVVSGKDAKPLALQMVCDGIFSQVAEQALFAVHTDIISRYQTASLFCFMGSVFHVKRYPSCVFYEKLILSQKLKDPWTQRTSFIHISPPLSPVGDM